MSAPIPVRWYCVDRVGVATLCYDEDDAVRSAAELGAMYPKRLPYIAVMLGDVAAERERCATLLERGIDLAGLHGMPTWQKFTADMLGLCADLIRKGDAA